MSVPDAAVDTSGVEGPHADRPVRRRGPALSEASAVVVLAHGRGATASGMLGLADDLGVGTAADETTYLAPAAARREWYPAAFTAPTDRNQPHLDSALAFLGSVVGAAVDAVGHDRTALVGFSQGACLASEWVARNPARYGGLAVLSGGLIGPPGTTFDYEGSLAGTVDATGESDEPDATPVFLGCSDTDPHIPEERVHESRDAFADLGADVDERIYPGLGHGINEDELDAVRELVAAL
ncbi:MAG: putative esterase [halophilic archaeon J07HB67]|nr:MAG: putative esterase [halophilic archaeon J07HB67]